MLQQQNPNLVSRYNQNIYLAVTTKTQQTPKNVLHYHRC